MILITAPIKKAARRKRIIFDSVSVKPILRNNLLMLLMIHLHVYEIIEAIWFIDV